MIIFFGFCILLYFVLDAACDAIDHMKGAEDLLELWHLLKALRNTIPVFIVLTALIGFKWVLVVIIPIMILLGVIWEICYHLFRAYEIYRWDNLNWRWLRNIWGFGQGE